ncbi:MAG: DUF4083 family protein [Desulfosporosinus sp.]
METVFDFTILAQIISLIFLVVFIYGVISLVKFASSKRKKEEETSKKLDRIIELLEKKDKNI